MIFAIVVNFTRPHAKELANDIVRYLQQNDVEVVAADDQVSELAVKPMSAVDPKAIDFLISFGGDGSILSVIHKYPHIDAPIMGVNLGTLGFLADVSPSSLYASIDQVLAGKYSVQERLMLKGTKDGVASCLGVNEMVVHRGPNHSLVDIGLWVDGVYFNTFSADGVIVSTPSGSTAYSLSAGGPIVDPLLDCLLITPICPHALSNRPIVLKMPQQIEIQYLSSASPVEVAFDGMCRFSLQPKEKFSISAADRRFRLVSVEGYDYFATLRSKLNWTGSLRN